MVDVASMSTMLEIVTLYQRNNKKTTKQEDNRPLASTTSQEAENSPPSFAMISVTHYMLRLHREAKLEQSRHSMKNQGDYEMF